MSLQTIFELIRVCVNSSMCAKMGHEPDNYKNSMLSCVKSDLNGMKYMGFLVTYV